MFYIKNLNRIFYKPISIFFNMEIKNFKIGNFDSPRKLEIFDDFQLFKLMRHGVWKEFEYYGI